MSDHSDKKHPDIPVEPDVMPSGKLFVWVGAMCALVIVMTILVWQEFNRASDKELQRKQLGRVEPQLLAARARDEKVARSYAIVDKKKNMYRIPLRAAQDLLMRTPTLLLPAEIKKTTPDTPSKAPEKPTRGKPAAAKPAPEKTAPSAAKK